MTVGETGRLVPYPEDSRKSWRVGTICNMKAVEQKQSKTLCKPQVLFTDAAGVV